LAAVIATPALAELVEVPSGMAVTFVEVVRDIAGTDGLTYRFRFIAPGVADETVTLDAIASDMLALCEDYAYPRVELASPRPNQIVISLADREVAFGVFDPEAVQIFEGYSFDETGACMVEFF
jgi:hypothetical protein